MTEPGISPGASGPLGATLGDGGVNFSLYSKDATSVELLFFDRDDDAKPSRVIEFGAEAHRTYRYFHVFVPGVGPGQLYAYRARGPYDPERGRRFDPDKILIDPYGLAVATPRTYDRTAASRQGANFASSMKSVVVDKATYDWEGDRPLGTPASRTIIYELHVGGFTKHPNSGVPETDRGTYRGLIHKIPYLKDLGVTAVELLPIFQFDATDAPPGLTNYWGYQPVSFFAPHVAYSAVGTPLGALDEFRDMVKALHRAGIEVILDVVFNHTAEGGEGGPTFCFRGLANDTYYILDSNGGRYANFTGCGNTLNANHTVVRRMIQDSLRYWVSEMHIDGFRFDLASVLARDTDGLPQPNPPVLWDIESDPILAGTKLIAEAWDAGGLYQVGSFVGDAWKEWNGQFRDDVRRFVKGDEGCVQRVARRLLGSPDIFGHEEREPEQSVNFVTCHDGFTLNDLVSYDRKHNEANQEDNRDGTNGNLSWNCGQEGPTTNPDIERLRNRQVKNLIAIEMFAAGMPMLTMGDEVRRTQRGNNNAYCQDNELSWFDWSRLPVHADVLRFVRIVCQMRAHRDTRAEGSRLTLNEMLERAHIVWHGTRLGAPDWSHSSHSLAFELTGVERTYRMFGILNAYWEPLLFELPRDGQPWRRAIDTALPHPEDIWPLAEAPLVTEAQYRAEARSVVLLGKLLDPASRRSAD